jgi:hypothetical protein
VDGPKTPRSPRRSATPPCARAPPAVVRSEPHTDAGTRGRRARSHCRFAPPFSYFIPDPPRGLVALFLPGATMRPNVAHELRRGSQVPQATPAPWSRSQRAAARPPPGHTRGVDDDSAISLCDDFGRSELTGATIFDQRTKLFRSLDSKMDFVLSYRSGPGRAGR